MPGSLVPQTVAAPPAILGSTAPDAFNLGRLVADGDTASKLRYGGGLNLLVFGPNGKGKGTRILIPNLLQMSGSSVVVVDPKGELAAITAPFRRRLGRVVILNPFGVLADRPGYHDLRSHGFNPLAALDPAARSFNAQASLLAQALVAFDPQAAHWDASAQALIAALIMYVVIEARRARRVPTMGRVRELLCQANAEPSAQNNYEGMGLPKLALEMMEAGLTGLRNKASQFTDWNREIQSIVSTAKRHTEPFDDPEIADDLAIDGFNCADLKREPVTVYLILPPEMMARHSKWLRLVLSSALATCLRPREPGEPRVSFMLDEFFALGHLEIISTVWALVRGYGVQIMPILQDLNQLKKLYPDMWETFIGMAGAVACFAPNDMTTAEWMSRRAGDTTRVAMNYNQGTGQSGDRANSSEGYSYSPVKAPLVTAHQLFGMRPGFMQLTLDGLSNVVPIYAPAYYEIRQCMERKRANPYFHGS